MTQKLDAISPDWSKIRVLITGAGRGIGAATAEEFAKRGSSLVLVARTLTQLEEVASSLQARYPQIEIQIASVDVSSEEQIQKLFSSIGDVLDVVIHNAGAILVKPMEKFSTEEWNSLLNVNLSSAFWIAREIFSSSKKPISYLTVSSLAGVMGLTKFQGFSAYAAAKAGLIGFTETLAVEGRRRNIRANVVCPGAVNTQMLREAIPSYKTQTQPSDLAEVIFGLIEKSFVEGQTGHVEVLSNE